MRKLILLLVFIFGCVGSSPAQITRLQARDAEWKNYAVPQTNFARQINSEKDLIFRVPADWKQQDQELIFNGPHSSTLTVTVQKLPDGYPLLSFFAAILQTLKDQPGAAEATVTRKTQLQDLEAREIFIEAPDDEGEMRRSTTWITVTGPLAVTFSLKVPVAHAAEIEPFFKAVVQSVIFLSPDYPGFEALRSRAIKSPAPGPIHEIESIVASLGEVNADRQSAATRLAALFSSHVDVAVDLLLDRRPLVRAAAVEALAKTNNAALAPILWTLIDDEEALVAEAAARAVAGSPDVVANTLKHSISGADTQIVARVWPFLAKDKRTELLQKLFSVTAVPRPGPPPAGKGPAKPGVKVVVAELIPVKPGTAIPDVAGFPADTDPGVQMGALTLLGSMSPDEFKLPLARVMASKHDPLIAIALQVAYVRGESLPVDALFKLVASSNQQVSQLAAQNFGFSASVADIPRIESLISKNAASTKKALDDELKASVRKIRFRHELSAAKSVNEQREIVTKALSDSTLADFAWRYHCEPTVAGCATAGTQTLPRDFNVKPFAENLFPKKVQHFTAIPNPGQAVQRFYETLHGLQLDSPRAQSNLILMMGSLRDVLARQLSAPTDAATLIEYTGIDPTAPISLGVWTANGAPDSTNSAKRRAIVLRVKDRGRFERLVETYQQTGGSFTNLTDRVAVGTRVLAALPALLPFIAQVADDELSKKQPDEARLLKYAFVGEKEWNGLRIKTFEHVWIDSNSQLTTAATYLASIGETVILTADLASIRDLLNTQADRQFLADNPEFRKSIESRGDIVYFSDLAAVMADATETATKAAQKTIERGALNITGSTWENTHHLAFDESDWAKPLHRFHPKELSAPRDLLPASTIVYWLMNVDLDALWTSTPKDLFTPAQVEAVTNRFALDVNKEVLPELGPECGAVVLELFDLETTNGGSMAVFCKLKSNKLADALKTGKLFRGVGPVTDFTELKIADVSYFVSVRKGFLVVANTAKTLEAFDGKTNLAATRDYSRAVEKVPGGIIAFGGYNLEAAIAAARKTSPDGPAAEAANLFFSVASAFHSQNFYATATAGTIEGRSSVAMDREGRYPVADLSYLPRGTNITFVTVEPAGIPIRDQKRVSSLVLKVRAKSPGPIDNIKDDIKSPDQTVEQKTPNELLLTVAARRSGVDKPVELPIKDAALEPYLKATTEFPADNEEVKKQAREIAGDDRDAWSVARKLADWTHTNLEWKKVVSATATETLATREADCSEFSQLFVTMARSVGLPARMVSGLAYSGTSFGGHAWVEVWAGKWIELDPTWGTHFVDATHIRNSSNTLVMSAALNLIEFEVLETRRSVADFQKSPKALMDHLVQAIPAGAKSDIEAAIDMETLTDEFMGAGSWGKLNEVEREQMWSAYRRLLREIQRYGKPSFTPKMRLLHLEEKGDVAEAICYYRWMDMLLKLRLVRRNDVWSLVEILQTDTHLYSAAETLRPTIAAVEESRAGKKVPAVRSSDFMRVLLLLRQDVDKAIAAADGALKLKPQDQGLRYFKALALFQSEKGAEAAKVLRELGNEGFAPAVYKLAGYLSQSEDENEIREAIGLYERYTSLEPHDPRGFRNLGEAYASAKKLVEAEAAYRKAIERDPANTSGYLDLIHFFIVNDRIEDARVVLAASDKYKDEDDDLFGSALQDLHIFEQPANAEKFAATEPLRMQTSYQANYSLAQIFFDEKRYADAMRLLQRAAQLDKEEPAPHVDMAIIYRKQSRWSDAVKAARRAIALNAEYSEAYYQLACALTRLGRTKEAVAALAKSVELDEEQIEYMVDEADLKALSRLPEFRKLIPKPDKQ